MRTIEQGISQFALEYTCESRAIRLSLCLTAVLASSLMAASLAEAQVCPATAIQAPDSSVIAKISSAQAVATNPVLCPEPDPAADNPREPIKVVAARKSPFARPDINREIYYRNKLEFSLDVGWLPVNIPFPFDVFEGDPYDLYPIRYTLVPVMASLRWHLGDPWGPPVLRGNWDLTFSASATVIPRGPETHYFSYDMGLRRNFIPRNWRATPYWDVRAGVGYINAKGPLGVYYAQGQNFTFNINMGAGARYNLNRRYAISAGLNWMHISNGNLSSPAYSNYGINVYGPIIGLDIQLRPNSRKSE